MLISVPTVASVVSTNVTDATPLYDPAATYIDKDLVQYDDTINGEFEIFGVFNDDTLPDPHHRLVYYSATAPNAVVDGKNYSIASGFDVIEYEIISNGKFDTVAFGGLIGEFLNVEFLDVDGNVVYTIVDREINNQIDILGRHPYKPTTEVLYCPVDIERGGKVKITIRNSDEEVEVGTILTGLSVQAGFTNLLFQNKFKDFSPTEQDQWGNVSYIEGTKVNIHTGTVDAPIQAYDFMNRMMLAIGGKIVIVNGSGERHNDKPDAFKGHFYATMMIGRMKNFALTTTLDKKRLGEVAKYKIEIEEIV